MAITLDILDRFQENKVFQAAQVMSNILRSSKSGSFLTMETVTFYIRSSKKYLFGFNHSNYVIKTEFFKKSSRTLISATCYSSTQSYFKIDLDLTMLSSVYFLCRQSSAFRATDKELPKAGQE